MVKEADFLTQLQAISRRTGYMDTGDDAAILSPFTISTDQFIEGTHFSWDWISKPEVGYKAIVQALSDLAAMGSKPKALLCSLSWPNSLNNSISSVFEGIEAACLEYNCPLIGGDTSSNNELFYMDVTVIGTAQKPIKQSGAEPEDLLVVSGPLGSAAGGLTSLKKNLNYSTLETSFKRPKAQINLALILQEKEFVTSMTDISDGLSRSLFSLSNNSNCGFEFKYSDLPYSAELLELTQSQKSSLKDYILYGGEDYQLLMTIKADTPRKELQDLGLHTIGHGTKAQKIIGQFANEKLALPDKAWDHFDL